MPSSSLPSPQTSPGSSKSPRASSSPLLHNASGIPPPSRRQNSRSSEATIRPSRTSSKASRIPRSAPEHDNLRDTEIVAVPDETFSLRDRAPSNRSLPRESHVPQDTPQRRGSLREPLRDVNEIPGESMHKPRISHGHPFRASVSGDSRVSTPLFLPDGAARPKETHRRSKHRNATADSERGFDSGFFGSEGSRISRGHQSPDIPSTFYPENKLRSAPLQEQSVTETEDERPRMSMPKITPKLFPRSRDLRRRRSSLQSLSESEEDQVVETTHSKPPIRTPSSQRERRNHRHTPTHPTPRSDSEGVRRLDDTLRRHASSPSLYDGGTADRSAQSGVDPRASRTTSRHEKPATPVKSNGEDFFSSQVLFQLH